MMGASGDPPAPGHRVAVDAFWMDLHEVTYDQLCAFLNDAKPDRALRLTWLALGGEPEKEFNTGFAYGPKVVREEDGRFTVAPGFEQYPVAWVSHVGAEAYAAWAGRKLPTDAQWELAARAGKEGQSYHWGQDPSPPPGVGNLADESLTNIWPQLFGYKGYNDGFVVASPVCSFPPNAFGLLDMEGNMAEWCGTAHERGGYVIRGGLYNGNQSDYRLDSRRSEKEDFVWDTTGFRCAAPVE
jgi:formylglycine-generating enzyme required for sulfatase activity